MLQVLNRRAGRLIRLFRGSVAEPGMQRQVGILSKALQPGLRPALPIRGAAEVFEKNSQARDALSLFMSSSSASAFLNLYFIKMEYKASMSSCSSCSASLILSESSLKSISSSL